MTPALGGASGNLFESAVQADGSILLWSQANSFLVGYSGTEVRTYQFPRLGYFAGAARLNGHLYFARNDPHEQTSVFGRLHDP